MMIEHNMQVIMRLADRILALHAGRPIAFGVPEQVRNEPAVGRGCIRKSRIKKPRAVIDAVAASIDRRWRPDSLAGHMRFELANPSARYLIGARWRFRLRSA